MSRARILLALASAYGGLRMYWRGALLVALAAAVAIATATPIVALASGLDLGRVMSGLDQTWSPQATAIVVFQRQALHALLAPLLGAAGGVIGLTGVTILVGSAARAGQRSGEIGIRRAVGASQHALALMAVLEALLLGGAALLASSGFAVAAFRLAQSEWPGTTTMPPITRVAAIGAAFLATFLVGALFVLVPTRSRTVQVASGPPLELYLAAALLSVGLVVVTSSSLLSRHVDSMTRAPSANPGASAIYRVEASRISAPVRAREYSGLLAALGTTPGIFSASIATPGVALGLGEVGGLTTDCGDCADGNLRLPFRLTTATRHLVSADTFDAIGARVIEGRGITAQDSAGGRPVVVVNRALARRHFQYGQPLGRRLQLDGIDGWYTVVGVIDEPAAIGFGAAFLPRYAVYLSVLQHSAVRVDVMLRAVPGHPVPDVGAIIAGRLNLGTGMPVAISEAALRASQLAPLRWLARWLAIEGWAGWIIAALGTLMLVRQWIGALMPELGLRRAVGARRGAVFATVIGRVALAAIGGVACALWFGPGAWFAFTSVVPTLPPWEPTLALRYGGVLLAVSVVAALPGAWRAMRMGPAALVEVTDN